ncbi:MAG: hypothetical protein LBR55_01305, partial [Bacteroidales bacterium]|nr:hypothetical protein [Bacteroidales bacterium]
MKHLFFTAIFAVLCAFTMNAQTFKYNGETLVENTTFTKQTSPGKTTTETPEVSGLAASRTTTGYYWANCDDPSETGENGYIYALNPGGSVRMKLKTNISMKYGSPNNKWDKQDWEDICMATRKEGGVDKNYIIVGGFGDNKFDKKGVYYLYIIPEPTIDGNNGSTKTASGVITITFSFPGGISSNNEAVMYDPVGDQIIVITKETNSSKTPTGNPSRVYKTPFRTSNGTVTLTAVKDASNKDLTLGKGKSENNFFAISAADMSMDGKYVLVMNADKTEGTSTQATVLYWERKCATEPFDEMIRRAPQYVTAYKRTDDAKGEAIAWSLDGKSFITTSDDTKAMTINQYTRPNAPVIAVSCTNPVTPTKVNRPTLIQNIFTYTGSTITVKLNPENTTLYTITSGSSGKDVNTYTAKVSGSSGWGKDNQKSDADRTAPSGKADGAVWRKNTEKKL